MFCPLDELSPPSVEPSEESRCGQEQSANEIDSAGVSPTEPFVVEEKSNEHALDEDVFMGPVAPQDPLAALTPNEFLQLRHPGPYNLVAFAQMSKPQLTPETRFQILAAQDSLWADDEIRWHLNRIVHSHASTDKVFLDPLIVTAVVESRNVAPLYQWMKTLDAQPKVIVTVLWQQQHWIPFAWTWTPECLTSHSWDVQGAQHHFGFLHDAVAKLVGARTFISHLSYRQFALTDHCGACAVRWIQHFIAGKMLPASAEEVQVLHDTARQMYTAAIADLPLVPRPWIWGRGLDPVVNSRLLDLLRQHGVPSKVVESRAALTVQAIGVAPLQKALIGSSPWRNLKALANQVRPALQLVLPDELSDVLKDKVAAGIANPKRKGKQMHKGAAAPSRPPQLDPSKIRFDAGVFVDCHDLPLHQIQVEELGPASSGVAVSSLPEVQQFLKGGPVTTNPLAVFLLNAQESDLVTTLTWSQSRVAARCALNGEPMLLQGFLIQLGAAAVVPKAGSTPVEVGDVEAACMKVTVYRDSIQMVWSDFCKAPVKYILQCLVPLQCCSAGASCHCEKWHASDDCQVRDPVLDVWRRQWLNMSFRPTTVDAADVFAVNVRYAKSAEETVMMCSGKSGVFLEPRSLDGKASVGTYHVVWMPRSSQQELQHLRQTTGAIVGIARMGARLGLRTLSADAAKVAEIVRPGSFVLSQGERIDFELGPLPFGMDRAAVASLCSNFGWKVKPLNPLRTVTNELGIVWHVQSCVEPSRMIIATKHGEVVVNRIPPKTSQAQNQMPSAVASSATLKLCEATTSTVSSQPGMLKSDPWAEALSKVPVPPIADPSQGLKQVEARIERAIMAKLPKISESMEIDSADIHGHDQRLGALEAQVQKLVNHQQHVDCKLDEVQRRTDAQITQLHHQVQTQLESQGSHIEQLFQGQLQQIEQLLGKRARTE